jgi:hypothetical protein
MSFGEPLGTIDDGYIWEQFKDTNEEIDEANEQKFKVNIDYTKQLTKAHEGQSYMKKVNVNHRNDFERCTRCTKTLKACGKKFAWKTPNRYYCDTCKNVIRDAIDGKRNIP